MVLLAVAISLKIRGLESKGSRRPAREQPVDIRFTLDRATPGDRDQAALCRNIKPCAS